MAAVYGANALPRDVSIAPDGALGCKTATASMLLGQGLLDQDRPRK